MSDDSRGRLSFYLMGGGLLFFYDSFRKMKLRRRIKDTATSKIASAALGNSVEIHAEVVSNPGHFITSPLTGKKCIAFLWKLEKETGSGKNRSWTLQYTFYSTAYIYLTDETKAYAGLDLSSCEFQEDMYGDTKHFNDSSYEIPNEVLDLLKSNGMITGEKSFLFSNKYRISEKIIAPGESFFILGSARSTPATEISFRSNAKTKFGKRKQNILGRLESAFERRKVDPEMIMRYDKNGNMKLDESEAEALYRDLERLILRKYEMSSLRDEYLKRCKFILSQAESGGILDSGAVCVSKKSQQQLVNSLGSRSFLGFFGGPLLFILGLWLFIYDENNN